MVLCDIVLCGVLAVVKVQLNAPALPSSLSLFALNAPALPSSFATASAAAAFISTANSWMRFSGLGFKV
jgi:hypothetical protein